MALPPIEAVGLNADFRDFLAALLDCQARFLVAGAHALAAHGLPRATGDLDVWVEATPSNAERVWQALVAFGAPTEALGFSPQDLVAPEVVLQMGVPPRRIDLLTGLTGLEFEPAWQDRLTSTVDGMTLPFLGRLSLVRNKRATGRLKDIADLAALGETP